ncbi:hypothetical protein CFC21_044090 [Triticum aestivum]|uniref:F-box protein At3g26010-like beta-propeller domain-containing protein n=3 Tax=Triticum TaxID=4564 RepID=A0A9R1QW73_TRITD|nr:hypothetical protein CFC21_044090 [Triticum aestivum]VAH84814.1 unnamed protein product [Triticum turgidum subsp. durum]
MAVEIYSSKTGGWVYKEIEWYGHIVLIDSPWAYVFLNGCLHFLYEEANVAVVGTEGKTWRNVHVPHIWNWDEGSFIHQSQGSLHYSNFEKDHVVPCLVVYVLEDYDREEWVLKHRVETSYLSDLEVNFGWVAIHPDSNLIFFTIGQDKTLRSYIMEHRNIQVIHA